MDHWGDPWADSNNANETASPTKPTVTTPLSTTLPDAPPLLNSYWDDAGWGNDGNEPTVFQDAAKDEWQSPTTDFEPSIENDQVVSEPSDTSTTIQQDDDDSIHPSTSPSVASHVDLPVESPRTSFEDERVAAKVDVIEEGGTSIYYADLESVAVDKGADTLREEAEHVQAVPLSEALEKVDEHEAHESRAGPVEASIDRERKARPIAVSIDPALFSELFPPALTREPLAEAPDNPIYSTSSRQAWYRLTRKQTLREFNAGQDQDNYVRITWASSSIRSEVNKVVGRWAREDRISGTGPGARASFYWDTPAPEGPIAPRPHARHQSVMHVASTASAPNRQSLPLMSKNVPAAFNWSSASPSQDPWQTTSPILPTVSTNSSKQLTNTVLSEQKHHAEPLRSSMERMESWKTSSGSGLSVSTSTPISAVASTNTNPFSKPSIPAASMTMPDTLVAPPAEPVDDDDDWGEMISSPQNFTPITPHFPTAAPGPIHNTPATAPSQRSVSAQMSLAETVSDSAVVRLKSTVSPTSALFKKNAFVPMTFEDMPIGPHLLKKIGNRSASEPVQQEIVEGRHDHAVPGLVRIPDDDRTRGHDRNGLSPLDDKSFEDSASWKAGNTFAYTEPLPLSTSNNDDAWADADFSFFETGRIDPAPLVPATVVQESATKLVSPTHLKQHGHSTLGPLSSSSRDEAEQAMRTILHRLPDLSYMLR